MIEILNHPGWGSVCWPIFAFSMWQRDEQTMTVIGAILAVVAWSFLLNRAWK